MMSLAKGSLLLLLPDLRRVVAPAICEALRGVPNKAGGGTRPQPFTEFPATRSASRVALEAIKIYEEMNIVGHGGRWSRACAAISSASLPIPHRRRSAWCRADARHRVGGGQGQPGGRSTRICKSACSSTGWLTRMA